MLNELLAYYPGKILFVLYPDRQSCLNAGPWEAGNREIEQFLSHHRDRVTVMNVRLLKGWDAKLYRDGIHPNEEGNRLLGLNIAGWILK